MDTHYTYRSHKHIHMCIYVYEFLDKCISNYSPRNNLIQMTSHRSHLQIPSHWQLELEHMNLVVGTQSSPCSAPSASIAKAII